MNKLCAVSQKGQNIFFVQPVTKLSLITSHAKYLHKGKQETMYILISTPKSWERILSLLHCAYGM